MAGADGRWVLSFNGEIYNFLELRPLLEAQGRSFRGRTDTEVLLETLATWGTSALERLDGQFAFAAFDTASGELLLARDPFGEKPLYYIELPQGGLAFASELQALETLPFFDWEVSLDAVGELLMFQYIGAPRSIYSSVRKLPPGHWLRARPGQPPEVHRYFAFRPGSSGFHSRPLADLADEAEDILVRSLRRRMISDVPLGAFLSAGVDSSTVCALIRKRLQVPLKTFSIGFNDAEESEHEGARLFARLLATEHHDEILDPAPSDFLSNIGAVLDEPNADSSCMPTYLLSRFARQHVTVAISGDGGDELFCGYGRYFSTLEEARTAGKRWSPGSAYYSGRILVSSEKHVKQLLGFVPEGLIGLLARLRKEVDDGASSLECTLRRTDVGNYMPGAVLAKVDRMSMQHSLEVRTPFLNVELARFSERLPLGLLYREGKGKVLLKEIGARYLPRELLDAPKRGFGIPMSGWGRDALLKVLEDMLKPGESRIAQMIGSETASGFISQQRSPLGYSSYQTWAVCTLESWLRHHAAKLPDIETQKGLGRQLQAAARVSDYYVPEKPITPTGQAVWYARQFVLHYRIYGVRATWSLVRRNLPRVLRWTGHKLGVPAITAASYACRSPLLVGRLARITWEHGNSTLFARAREELHFYRHGTRLLERVRSEVAREDPARPANNSLKRGDPILLLTYALPPGGAERQWCYLAIGLKDQGYGVCVVLIAEPQGSNGHYLPLLLEHGLEVIVLRRSAARNAGKSLYHSPFRELLEPSRPFGMDLGALADILSLRKPKAVLAQLDYPNLLAGTAALLAGVPQVVMSFRNYNPTNFSYLRNDWFLPFYRTVCKSSRVLLSGNSILANRDYASWIGVPTERVARISNAIDIDAWKPVPEEKQSELRRKLRIADGAPIVVGVFRLSEEKRPLDFVEVCRRIHDRCRDACFLIVGEGPMKGSLEALVRKYDLQTSVHLLGRRTDTRELMSLATLLLHTSGFEGMPNVIMEAQAIGRPVVATRAGATEEIVRHGKSGFLVDIGDLERLAEYSCELIMNPLLTESFGVAARGHVHEHFSIEQLAQQHVDLLNRHRTEQADRGQSTVPASAGRKVA